MNRFKINVLPGMMLLVMLLSTSCERLIDVGMPQTEITAQVIFEDDITAQAVITSLYSGLSGLASLGGGGFESMTYLASLSSDELLLKQGGETESLQFNSNELLSTNKTIESLWRGAFRAIYEANAAIAGLQASDKITPDLSKQLLGEAKFFRAFYYFYLINLFGDVPYVTTTDYRTNGLVKRQPVVEIYNNITTDLLEAKALLAEDYSYSKNTDGEPERVGVNKWAATALLARVYLYQQDWSRAEEQASVVINKTGLYELVDLDKVFLKNSREAIWQLTPPAGQSYTSEGNLFNRGGEAGIPVLTDTFLQAFEPADDRQHVWIISGMENNVPWSNPFKYKETNKTGSGAEYYMVLRLAELYLIRAEARAWQNKLTGNNSGESDLNIIRERAGLLPVNMTTKNQLLTAIEQERRMEFFAEWGHRWLDLKRTGRVNDILGAFKSEWDETDVLYPIPYSELQLNPNMTQNDNY